MKTSNSIKTTNKGFWSVIRAAVARLFRRKKKRPNSIYPLR